MVAFLQLLQLLNRAFVQSDIAVLVLWVPQTFTLGTHSRERPIHDFLLCFLLGIFDQSIPSVAAWKSWRRLQGAWLRARNRCRAKIDGLLESRLSFAHRLFDRESILPPGSLLVLLLAHHSVLVFLRCSGVVELVVILIATLSRH